MAYRRSSRLLQRVRGKGDFYGSLICNQFSSGGFVRGMLLLSGGVSGRAAAAQAADLHGAQTVPVRGAHRRPQRERRHRPAAGEHPGSRTIPRTCWTFMWWRTTAPTAQPPLPESMARGCLSGRTRWQVGKGYALAFLLEHIREDFPQERYDGYFVFDADNLLDPHYVTEMNKVFSNGNRGRNRLPQHQKLWGQLDHRGLWHLVFAGVRVPEPPPRLPGHQLRRVRHGLPLRPGPAG